jgi:hypothetical protein
VVFRQAWVIIAVLVMLVGVGTRQPAVAAMGILVLLTGGLAGAGTASRWNGWSTGARPRTGGCSPARRWT